MVASQRYGWDAGYTDLQKPHAQRRPAPIDPVFRPATIPARPGAGPRRCVDVEGVVSMLVSSYISPKAVKGGPSSIEGRGLRAVEAIARDEIVAIKGGHVVDTTTLRALPERLRNSEVQIADGFHLVALDDAEYEPVMLFINHSCEPNVGFVGNVVLAAMRDVEAGEELTTDYALFDLADEALACACGTASCRGTVSGDDWRDPVLQQRYAGWFSTYLADRIARAETGGTQ